MENELTLYVYETETRVVVDRITGDTNKACEQIAADRYGDTDVYGWTYSPAFGCVDGLLEVR